MGHMWSVNRYHAKNRSSKEPCSRYAPLGMNSLSQDIEGNV